MTLVIVTVVIVTVIIVTVLTIVKVTVVIVTVVIVTAVIVVIVIVVIVTLVILTVVKVTVISNSDSGKGSHPEKKLISYGILPEEGGGSLGPIHNFEANFCASQFMEFLMKIEGMVTFGHFF